MRNIDYDGCPPINSDKRLVLYNQKALSIVSECESWARGGKNGYGACPRIIEDCTPTLNDEGPKPRILGSTAQKELFPFPMAYLELIRVEQTSHEVEASRVFFRPF